MKIDIEKLIEETPYIWSSLQNSDLPTLIYGTGNGADKIIDICEAHGITVSGIFASDGFVRSRDFRGHHVISYGEAVETYGERINILAAFGSTLPSVTDRFYDLSGKHSFYLPYAPLYGGEIYTPESLLKYRDKIDAVYSTLSDEPSRNLFRSVIKYRLSGKIEHLRETEDQKSSYKHLIHNKIENVIDLGAFKGDSASMMIDVFPTCKTLLAVEPDKRSFKKLELYAQAETRCRIIPINAAISDISGTAEFRGGGSRGAAIDGIARRADEFTVTTVTLDELAEIAKPDLIKFDTEGYELEAIRGGTKTLLEASPALALSVYHKSHDFFELPLLITELMPNKRLYLRRAPCLPDWDITLFAV